MKQQQKNLLIKFLIIALFVAGVLLKLYYISYTEVWERQHDVIGFGATEGHAAYIEYILNNGKIPDFDPRSVWAFFQPPLHHIICATVLRVCGVIGVNERASQEFLQFVTTLYMVVVMILSVLILSRLVVKDEDDCGCKKHGLFLQRFLMDPSSSLGTYVALCVIAVHPIFTIMSGSINNDALSLVLAVASIYLALKWYEKTTMARIIPIAIAIGLSMMAKLTGGLVAVPIGTLMLLKFYYVFKSFRGEIKGIDDDVKGYINPFKRPADLPSLGDLIFQFIAFAIIVFPLGLYWTIRNKIKFDMPANYIPPVGEQLGENMTLSKRLFDLRLNNPFPVIEGNNGDYNEFNVFISLIKTSLFGEWDFSTYSGKLTIIAWGLLVTAVAVIILCLIATFYMTFSKKSKLSHEGRIVLFLTWITYLAAYLAFALSYNNFSAEDFRYGAICIVSEGIFLGLFSENISSKALKNIIFILSTLFAFFAFTMYVCIGIKAK